MRVSTASPAEMTALRAEPRMRRVTLSGSPLSQNSTSDGSLPSLRERPWGAPALSRRPEASPCARSAGVARLPRNLSTSRRSCSCSICKSWRLDCSSATCRATSAKEATDKHSMTLKALGQDTAASWLAPSIFIELHQYLVHRSSYLVNYQEQKLEVPLWHPWLSCTGE